MDVTLPVDFACSSVFGEGVEIKSAMVADGVPSGFMGSNGNGEDHRPESTDERLSDEDL